WRSGIADFGQPRANAVLTREKRRSTRGATLLAVVVEKADALFGNPIDIRRLIAHQAAAIGTDVGDADIVAKNDEDIRFFGLLRRGRHRQASDKPDQSNRFQSARVSHGCLDGIEEIVSPRKSEKAALCWKPSGSKTSERRCSVPPLPAKIP